MCQKGKKPHWYINICLDLSAQISFGIFSTCTYFEPHSLKSIISTGSSISCVSLDKQNSGEEGESDKEKCYSTSAPASTNCLLVNFEVLVYTVSHFVLLLVCIDHSSPQPMTNSCLSCLAGKHVEWPPGADWCSGWVHS